MPVDVSFVLLLAYDFRYAIDAIRSFYSIADEIILGLDKNRISMRGKPFDFDAAWIKQQLTALDTQRKIKLIEEDFHSAGSPMQNETHERNVLSQRCNGKWIAQIDSDEVLLNPKPFRKWLDENPDDCTVWGQWLNVFKIIDDSYLLIENPNEFVPLATVRKNGYVEARRTAAPDVLGPARILHNGWARSREEVLQKLTNWSHSDIARCQDLLTTWDDVSLHNYHTYRDFHPFASGMWKALHRVRAAELASLQDQFAQGRPIDWPDADPRVVLQMSGVDRPAHKDAIEAASRRNMIARRVLELGCGTGKTGAALKRVLQSNRYVGIESNESAACAARSMIDDVRVTNLQTAAPSDFGLEDDSFDLLVALDVLDHLHDPWSLLARWNPCLQQEGLALLSFSNLQFIQTVADIVEGRWRTGAGEIGDPRRRHLFTRFGVESMLNGAGFDLVHIDSVLPPQFNLSSFKQSGNTLKLGRVELHDLTLEEVIAMASERLFVIARPKLRKRAMPGRA